MARSFSRRTLLLGSVGVGLVAGGAAAGIVIARRDEDAQGTPETPEPGTDPTPTPTPGPPTAAELVMPVDDAFERRVFDLARPVEWSTGIVFLDTATKVLIGWQLRNGTALPGGGTVTDGGAEYRVFRGGAYVACESRSDSSGAGFVHQRTSDKSWAWDLDKLALVAGSERYLLFEHQMGQADPGRHTGRYEVLDAVTLQPVSSFELPVSRLAAEHLFSPDGGKLATWVSPQGPNAELYLTDVQTGSPGLVYTPEPEMNGAMVRARTDPGDAEPGQLRLHVRYDIPPDAGGAGPAFEDTTALEGAIDWATGAFVAPMAARPPGWERSFTAEGLAVRADYLRYVPTPGPGEHGEQWAAAVVEDASGNALLRVKSAALGYGDRFPMRRWLADGSGFVAGVAPERASDAESGFERLQYAIFRRDGSMERFPDLPPIAAAEPRWFERRQHRGPVPAPDDANLLSFGRWELFERSTGEFTRILIANGEPSHLDPWATGSGRELVLAFGHGGHDGGPEPIVVGPKAEFPPFSEELLLVITGAGDCLNLRDTPGAEAPVIDCIPDGNEMLVTELTPFADGVAMAYFVDEEAQAWACVATLTGVAGWVSPDYLAWA